MKPSHRFFVLALSTSLLVFVSLQSRAEDAPTSQPADSPEVKNLRQQLVDWNTQAATMSLADLRKVIHTENDREAVYCDWMAHEMWEESKTQAAVRKKWGPDAEAKFAHANNTDTIEDDQTASIKIDGDRAVVTFGAKEILPTSVVRIDGRWLIDMHAMFDVILKDNPNGDKDHISTGKLMQQAAADIAADKFDDADAFMKDFQAKMQALTGGN
jgi:hypothetical protein